MCSAHRLSSSRGKTALLAMLLTICAGGTAMAAPTTIAVEGRLMTAAGGPVADGTYNLTFRLYASAKAAKAAWTEIVAKLPVKGGRFQHRLGTITPLDASVVDVTKAGWLGTQVGAEPELARNPIHSVPFALRSQLAEAVSCTGCISLKALKIDGNLALGSGSLKAKQVTATTVKSAQVSGQSLLGDGSKLTGLALPKSSCKAGEVAIGVQSSGAVKCSKVEGGGVVSTIEQASGGLLTTAFTAKFSSEKVPLSIPDNNPLGVSDEIVVPDVGKIATLSVSLKLSNSNFNHLKVLLYDPENAAHSLHVGLGIFGNDKKTSLDTSYPSPTPQVGGNLKWWFGKNPKGKWRIKIVDDKFLNNKTDGELTAWSIQVETSGGKQITSKGTFVSVGGFGHPTASGPPFSCNKQKVGYMYYDTKTAGLYYCDGDWRRLLTKQTSA